MKILQIENLTELLPHHASKYYNNRSLLDINTITVHHSASENANAKTIALYHVKDRDWPGIGYHYIIKKDGKALQVNDLKTISYHSSGNNLNSLGVCLIGDFTKTEPTVSQLDTLFKLTQYLASILPLKKVEPHSAQSNTACPGDYLGQYCILVLQKLINY